MILYYTQLLCHWLNGLKAIKHLSSVMCQREVSFSRSAGFKSVLYIEMFSSVALYEDCWFAFFLNALLVMLPYGAILSV